MTRAAGWLAVLAVALHAAPALAGWKVMPAGRRVAIAGSALSIVPGADWNRASTRPGRRAESWTLDGLPLNELTLFAAVAPGEPIYRERSRKDEPLPRFDPAMLPPDIVQLFEASQRIVLGTSLYTIERVEPAVIGGHAGARFTYRFTLPDDEVRRRGEAHAAVVGGRLYIVAFAAPEIH